MQPLAIWLTCVCRHTPCMVASNYVPWRLGLCWSRVPGLLPVSAASPSVDHKHGTVCQPILEHQIRPCAPSSVISGPTCFSSSLRCCWQVASAPFFRCRCDCLASSAPFTNIHTYLLTYLLTYLNVVAIMDYFKQRQSSTDIFELVYCNACYSCKFLNRFEWNLTKLELLLMAWSIAWILSMRLP